MTSRPFDGRHDEEVLRGEVVDVGDLADLHAVADDGEADELVVVPRVGLGRLVDGWSTQRMAFTRPSAAVRSSTPSKNPTGWPLYQRSSRSVRCLPCHGDDSGTCSENSRPDEAALGVVGVELELDGALEAVRLGEAADAELRGGGPRRPRQSSVSTTSTRTRRPSARAVTSVRSAFAVRPARRSRGRGPRGARAPRGTRRVRSTRRRPSRRQGDRRSP